MATEAAGTTVCVRRLVQESIQAGWPAEVVTINDAGLSNNRSNTGFNIHSFKSDFRSVPSIRRLAMSRSLSFGLGVLARDAAVIHNHGLWMMPNVASGIVSSREGLPLVISPHGMLGPGALQFSRWKKRLFWYLFQKAAAAGCACWHATSEKELEDIRSFGLRAPVAVIPNGIDDILPAGKPHLRRDPGTRTLLFLGRLHPKKGVDSLLRVWSGICSEFPDWQLEIAGPLDNSYAAAYEKFVREMAVPRVKFTGAKFGQERLEAYQEADLFVLPTLDENFGMTVAEALVCGKPVVCSRGAPWPELVSRGCGWWPEIGDSSLEQALRNAMCLSTDKLAKMGQRGRSWMLNDYRWNSISDRMLSVYSWLLGGGSRPDCVVL
ncbi:glycosyltransferase [Mesorhizobium sp. M0965]